MNERELLAFLREYEAKLKEYMTAAEYKEWAEMISKKVFFAEVLASPSKEFKDMVFENWDWITGGTDGELR